MWPQLSTVKPYGLGRILGQHTRIVAYGLARGWGGGGGGSALILKSTVLIIATEPMLSNILFSMTIIMHIVLGKAYSIFLLLSSLDLFDPGLNRPTIEGAGWI